jgi:hypothetical protein
MDLALSNGVKFDFKGPFADVPGTEVSAALDTAKPDVFAARCVMVRCKYLTRDDVSDRCGNTNVALAVKRRSVPQGNLWRVCRPEVQCRLATREAR